MKRLFAWVTLRTREIRTGQPIPETQQEAAQLLSVGDAVQEIETAFAALRGEIDQIPPMYSAKKQAGRKLYELARRGEEVERQPVRVCIYEFEAINLASKPTAALLKDNRDGTFDFEVRVVCSSGTYIRTLAEDFGKRLVWAHIWRSCAAPASVISESTTRSLWNS